MANQSFTGHAAGTPYTGNSEHSQINYELQKYLSVLTSPTATPQQKAQAANAVVRYQHQNAPMSATIQQILQQSGFAVSGNQLMYNQGGHWVPAGNADGSAWSAGGDVQSLDAGGPNARPGQANQWRTAALAASNNTVQPGGAADYNKISGQGGQNSTSQQPGAVTNLDPSGLSAQGKGYYGDVTGLGALTQLAGQPDDAFTMYLQNGGQGNGSLEDSGMSRYGGDQFKGLMGLEPYMNPTGDPTTGGLDLAGGAADQSLANKGQYIDPRKLFDQTLSGLSGQPLDTQERGVQTLLQNMRSFLPPTQFAMMQARVQKILDQYTAQQYQSGGQDLTGQLLKQIQAAAGY